MPSSGKKSPQLSFLAIEVTECVFQEEIKAFEKDR